MFWLLKTIKLVGNSKSDEIIINFLLEFFLSVKLFVGDVCRESFQDLWINHKKANNMVSERITVNPNLTNIGGLDVDSF